MSDGDSTKRRFSTDKLREFFRSKKHLEQILFLEKNQSLCLVIHSLTKSLIACDSSNSLTAAKFLNNYRQQKYSPKQQYSEKQKLMPPQIQTIISRFELRNATIISLLLLRVGN